MSSSKLSRSILTKEFALAVKSYEDSESSCAESETNIFSSDEWEDFGLYASEVAPEDYDWVKQASPAHTPRAMIDISRKERIPHRANLAAFERFQRLTKFDRLLSFHERLKTISSIWTSWVRNTMKRVSRRDRLSKKLQHFTNTRLRKRCLLRWRVMRRLYSWQKVRMQKALTKFANETRRAQMCREATAKVAKLRRAGIWQTWTMSLLLRKQQHQADLASQKNCTRRYLYYWMDALRHNRNNCVALLYWYHSVRNQRFSLWRTRARLATGMRITITAWHRGTVRHAFMNWKSQAESTKSTGEEAINARKVPLEREWVPDHYSDSQLPSRELNEDASVSPTTILDRLDDISNKDTNLEGENISHVESMKNLDEIEKKLIENVPSNTNDERNMLSISLERPKNSWPWSDEADEWWGHEQGKPHSFLNDFRVWTDTAVHQVQ